MSATTSLARRHRLGPCLYRLPDGRICGELARGAVPVGIGPHGRVPAHLCRECSSEHCALNQYISGR